MKSKVFQNFEIIYHKWINIKVFNLGSATSAEIPHLRERYFHPQPKKLYIRDMLNILIIK